MNKSNNTDVLCVMKTEAAMSAGQMKKIGSEMEEQLLALGIKSKTAVLTGARWEVEFIPARNLRRKLTLGERIRLLFTG